MIGNCSECNFVGVLSNAHFKLCSKCNNKRLGEGKTKHIQIIKRSKIMARSRPKMISNKQKQAHKDLIKVYKEIAEEREHICAGCHEPDGVVPLSNSHSIPRSRRKDLETDKNNIGYHCLTIGGRIGCHDKWASGDLKIMSQLFDFQDRMNYIRETDEEYYNLLMSKENK